METDACTEKPFTLYSVHVHQKWGWALAQRNHLHCITYIVYIINGGGRLHGHIGAYSGHYGNICVPCRPYSSALGRAKDTEIFRNMENFEKVCGSCMS